MKAKRTRAEIEDHCLVRDSIRKLPDSPGVYLFYTAQGELLYIGKSKCLRTRVRSHFATPEETSMCRKIGYIEVRKTVGELGALLLESQLIKDLRPYYNRMSRHKRRIILARRVTTPAGYHAVRLEPVSQIDPTVADNTLGIFKTRLQAKDFLSAAAKEHRLCLNLLGLEHSKRSCFSYHLHQCNGACIGLEPAELYNLRVATAFEERRIRAWPFPGAVIIEEKDGADGTEEVFVVDNWCLLYSFVHSARDSRLRVRGIHQFDYDSYRILAGYIFRDPSMEHVRPASREEISSLLRRAHAA
jgi:DNA polymerase-3 subunit epsilon